MPRYPDLVLFACTHNAGRSQMAAAFFNQLAAPTAARAISAGTLPGPAIVPEVVTAMREAGLELAGVTPQFLSPDLEMAIDYLVTMGCENACPHIAGIGRVDWPLDDPATATPAQVRVIRDVVRERVAALIQARGWAA